MNEFKDEIEEINFINWCGGQDTRINEAKGVMREFIEAKKLETMADVFMYITAFLMAAIEAQYSVLGKEATLSGLEMALKDIAGWKEL